MAYEQLKDLPFWQLCNQLPVATSALTCFATDENGDDPYIYALSGATFYRYSVNGDGVHLLASPTVAASSVASLRYTKRRGFHSRVISATSTTVQISGLVDKILDGEHMRILHGVGKGQERVLTFSSETIHDTGVITGTAANYIADSAKKWKINQWAGYLVHLQFGTDATQCKRILYNDATTLYISDAVLMPHNPWENAPFAAMAPYALPITTAGSQTHFQIRSQTFTVDTPWDVIPDDTSLATTLTGGLYLFSSAAAAPFFTLQYYDVAADNWQSKTCPQSLILAAIGTDVTLERTAKHGTPVITGTLTSATSRSITDTTKTLEVDRYKNYRVLLTGGTGIGQNRRIVCNTTDTGVFSKPFDVIPDATTTYELWPDFDKLYVAGGAMAAMYAYSPENDYWMQGQAFDDGIVSNIACYMKDWMPLAVGSGTRIAAGITGINPVPTAGGTNYLVGDVLTCNVGGSGAKVIVTSINPGGIVTGIELMAAGISTGFTVGTGRATIAGSGTGCTIEITSVGTVANIALASIVFHWFRTGQKVTFAGCTEAAYNAEHTILCVSGTNTFDIATTATASMVATASQSTTTLVDPSKNWVTNEHAGRILHLMVGGIAPTSQVRWIVSNTPTTLTVSTITAGVNGTSKYVIYDSKSFGAARLRKETGRHGCGHATSGSTTTLVDTTKNWIVNQFAGYKFKVEAGTGYGSGVISIISNTPTTLAYATQSFTPDATTHYCIHETWGIMSAGSTTSITDGTSKNWTVNQFAGKRVRITGGTALGQEASVTSNTATALTTGTITAPGVTSTYCLLEIPVRGAGIEMAFLFGTTDASKKQKYMMLPRGGNTNQIDLYDITTERFIDTAIFIQPNQELMTTGTMYAYDGGDNVYIHVMTGSIGRILRFNVKLMKITGAFQLSGLQGTALVGNRMEIAQDASGNKYLYIAQHSGTILWRTVLFDI
jgi:hypothetical protein